jgi:hypothetical protein
MDDLREAWGDRPMSACVCERIDAASGTVFLFFKSSHSLRKLS